MDISTYFDRIKYTSPTSVDLATLRGLQIAHMRSVPFENLDIKLKRPIRLSEDALWDKIIVHRRGGFCYELNGLYAWLLKQIGFEVTYLNARVFKRDGSLGIDFDHLALLVRIPGSPGRWLADAGFGDSFSEPLNMEESGEQVQGLRSYRLEQTKDGYITWQRNYDGTREQMYFFDLQPRNFPADYEAACLYHQTSPLSSFTRGNVISLETSDGRITLDDNRLIITREGQRHESPVASRAEFNELLKEHFNIVI